MKILNHLFFVALIATSTNSYSVELTPLFGYRGGGEFVDKTTDEKHTVASSDIVGLIVSWPYEKGKTYEIYYSHQSSDLNSISVSTPSPTGTVNIPLTFDYLHLGGTAPISSKTDFKTFLSGGLGFTYMNPDFAGAQSDLRASFSIGVGLKYPVSENIAIRLETRGLATLFNNNATLFCNGGCSLSVNGSLFIQGEVFAGLAIKF